MKIHILFKFKETAWGGGNQFLKALRDYLDEKGVYEEKAYLADAIIVNSHHNLIKAAMLKLIFPRKVFIHRIDGPINKGRMNGQLVDSYIFLHNRFYFDGSVFQSPWSKEQNIIAGFEDNDNSRIIINASNGNIFTKKEKYYVPKKKIKLVSTSWSTNPTKGFHIYEYLDDTLNFSDYEYTFVGNLPKKFKNIIHIPPVNSSQLAKILQDNDIFITASKDDPCSNSLIEAITVGLPAVALNSGGHPFIVDDNNGVLFNGIHDVKEAIENVSKNIKTYMQSSAIKDLSQIGDEYYDFIDNTQHHNTDRKKFGVHLLLKLLLRALNIRMGNK